MCPKKCTHTNKTTNTNTNTQTQTHKHTNTHTHTHTCMQKHMHTYTLCLCVCVIANARLRTFARTQLPGPHGTPVTLTFHRAANGRAFYDGCEVYTFNVKLRRSRDFFPDKLTQNSDTFEQAGGGGAVHMTPPPISTQTITAAPAAIDEDDFVKFGSPSHMTEQDSRLVDDILKSLGSPYASFSALPLAPTFGQPTFGQPMLAQPMFSQVVSESAPLHTRYTSAEVMQAPTTSHDEMKSLYLKLMTNQEKLIAMNEKTCLLEDQLERERVQVDVGVGVGVGVGVDMGVGVDVVCA